MTPLRVPFPRPGGLKITERALEFCRFPPRSRLADIGCGQGDTVRHLRTNCEMDVVGIDRDEALIREVLSGEELPLLWGDALCLPFEEGTLDGLLFECSFSKVDSAAKALEEARRVLRPGGYLIISGFYSLSEEISGTVIGRVERKETLISLMEGHGFDPRLFEDFSGDLRDFWAQLVFDHGLEFACTLFGAEERCVRDIGCGYGLFIGQRQGADDL